MKLEKTGGRRSEKLTYGRLAHVLLAAICPECQKDPTKPQEWWKDCPHNPGIGGPYVGYAEVVVQTPKVEETADGTRQIVGVEPVKQYVRRPNFVKVSLEQRVGSGAGVEFAKQVKGWIEPEDLKTDGLKGEPIGYSPFCDFADCMAQDCEDGSPLVEVMILYPETSYFVEVRLCRDIEYRLAVLNARGKPLEVQMATKRAEQLAAVV